MSELKYYKLLHRTSALTSPEFVSVAEFGAGDEVYLKSEAEEYSHWLHFALKHGCRSPEEMNVLINDLVEKINRLEAK